MVMAEKIYSHAFYRRAFTFFELLPLSTETKRTGARSVFKCPRKRAVIEVSTVHSDLSNRHFRLQQQGGCFTKSSFRDVLRGR